MTSSETKNRTTETRISIIRKAGKIVTNLLAAIFSALSVLSRLEMTEIAKANPATIYK